MQMINQKEFMKRMTSEDLTSYRNGMSDVLLDYIENNRKGMALIEDYACMQWVFMRAISMIIVDHMAQQIDLDSKKTFVNEAVRMFRELTKGHKDEDLFKDLVEIFYDRLKEGN